MTSLALGLIGGGRWGRVYMKTLSGHKNAHLAHLVSRNPENKGRVPQSCRITDRWQSLLQDKNPDGVIIATPPQNHFEMASRFIQSGIPVLIEKPVTMDAGQAQQLLKLAKTHKTTVMVDHIHVYSQAFQALKARARDLGPIRRIEGIAGNRGPVRKDVSVLWDWGAHDLAMCLDLLPELPALTSASVIETGAPENAAGQTIALSFADAETKIDLALSNILDKKTRLFKVYFDHHTLIYDDPGDDKLTELPSRTVIPVSTRLPLDCVIDLFAKAINDNDCNLESLELGVKVCAHLEHCQTRLDPEPEPQ